MKIPPLLTGGYQQQPPRQPKTYFQVVNMNRLATDTAALQPLYDRITEDLAGPGYTIIDRFLPAAEITTLADEAQSMQRQGEFRLAQVGSGTQQEQHPEIRNDRIHWLTPGSLSPAQQHYFDLIEALRLHLNRRLFLGLFEFEGFMAIYPPGSFYQKHWDRFEGMPHRMVTAILYLNESWQQSDGGILRLYLKGEEDGSSFLDIEPIGGRLVLFLSGRFPHEVMPANRDRLSLTGWLRIRPIAEESSQLYFSAS